MCRADADFIFGAHHTETFDTADFTDFDFFIKQRNKRTDMSQDTHHSDFDIGRTADNLKHLRAVVNFEDMQMIGIWMIRHFFNARRRKAVHIFKRINNFFNFQTDFGQGFGDGLNRSVCIQMFFKPR